MSRNRHPHHRMRASCGDIVRNNLLLYLDAGKTKSYPGTGNTWFDLSGYNNNATIIGSPTYTPDISGYFTSNAAGQYFSVPDSTVWNIGTGDYTVDLWTYLNTFNCPDGPAAPTLLSINNYGGSQSQGPTGLIIYIDNQSGAPQILWVYYVQFSPFIDRTVSVTNNIQLNTWYNIVVSRISGVYSFYFNNSLIGTVTPSAPYSIACTSNITIGFDGTSNNSTLQGRWSQVKIYNKGFNSTEVNQNFNANRKRYGI